MQQKILDLPSYPPTVSVGNILISSSRHHCLLRNESTGNLTYHTYIDMVEFNWAGCKWFKMESCLGNHMLHLYSKEGDFRISSSFEYLYPNFDDKKVE